MKLTNKHKLPQTYVDLISTTLWDPRESDPKRISVTTLIQNPRIKKLTLAHYDELESDVSDYLWLLLGNAVHYVMATIESNKEKSLNRLVEEKLIIEVNGFKIVGKLDLYEDKDKSIEDYKVTSVWSVQFGEHDDWEKQLNPYAWLLRKNGFEVKQARINAIIRDWRKSEGLRYEDYPKVPFVTIPVKLWTLEEQQAYIENRVEIYREIMDMPIAEVPICSSKERWAGADKYAVYKGTNKTATRVLDTAQEAEAYVKNSMKGAGCNIVKRTGEDKKCLGYCNVNKFCSYYQETYGKNK